MTYEEVMENAAQLVHHDTTPVYRPPQRGEPGSSSTTLLHHIHDTSTHVPNQSFAANPAAGSAMEIAARRAGVYSALLGNV